MKKIVTISSASALALAAGHAAAQVTVNGRLDAAEGALYGGIRWVQNVPTHFGDNAPPSGECNESQIGDPAAATTGVEYKIPLAAIGNPSGPIKILAVLANQGHNGFSNQTLPALPGPGAAALGTSRQVNFAGIAGSQYATVSASAGDDITCDGVKDAAYGAALALQASRTTVGDDQDASNATAGGSELDGLYAVIRNGNLCIMLTGNVKSDFGTKVELFLDTGAEGGLNVLSQGANLPDVDFGALQNMRGDGVDAGLTFDDGFNLTHYFTFGAGGDPVTYYPNLADLPAVVGAYLGNNNAGNGAGTLGGGNNPLGIEIAVDNGNTAGVGATCPPLNGDPDRARGSEIDNLYAYVDSANQKLHVFIGGNLETSYNKLDLFLDVMPGGQNTLRGDNVDIDFNGLNHMAGLTFDAGFEADYWFAMTNGNDPVEMYSNAAVLRTDGPRVDFNFNHLDYGAYDGGLKSLNNPIDYNGTRIDPQDGFTGNIFTNYAPRLSGDSLLADPMNPVGATGRILASINNSNLLGVTGDSASPALASTVTTGFEIELDLAELGWDGQSPIKIAGFINNGGHDYLSNQVLGGLPDGTDNLGNPSGINFATIDGNQFLDLSGCAADFNGDGFLDFFDYDDYVNCFETGTCPPGKTADFNGDQFADFFDYDDFVAAFERGC